MSLIIAVVSGFAASPPRALLDPSRLLLSASTYLGPERKRGGTSIDGYTTLYLTSMTHVAAYVLILAIQLSPNVSAICEISNLNSAGNVLAFSLSCLTLFSSFLSALK